MEYAKGTKLKEIPISHLDTRKDRKDVAYVKYSSNGMENHIVVAVIIS